MSQGPKVVIDVSGQGRGHVEIDGVRIPCVRSVSTDVYAGEPPVVKIGLAIADPLSVTLDGANVVVDEAVLPAALERALLRHLAAKYKHEIEVTQLNSTARAWVAPDF